MLGSPPYCTRKQIAESDRIALICIDAERARFAL